MNNCNLNRKTTTATVAVLAAYTYTNTDTPPQENLQSNYELNKTLNDKHFLGKF